MGQIQHGCYTMFNFWVKFEKVKFLQLKKKENLPYNWRLRVIRMIFKKSAFQRTASKEETSD